MRPAQGVPVPTTTSATDWVPLPGASGGVFVPANQSRLYDVPFFAESECGEDGTNYVIQVQFAVVNPMSVFTLDDWHLAVHTNL